MADHKSLYRLDAVPLGRGGQADVFRAEHRVTGQVVALKRRISNGQEATDRMRREIEVQAGLQHQNVMPVLEFDEDDHAWLAMPLAVASLAAATTPIATAELLGIIKDAIFGLQAAHERGYVHRDIKPHNILRLKDEHGDRWVVSDWGIVRRRDQATTAHHTRVGVLVGSEGFAPPEAYSDAHDATFAWDVYSLGRVVAWATTGRQPIPLRQEPAPEPWRRFVRLLTEADPLRRPSSLGRVLALLENVTNELPVAAGVSDAQLTAAKAGDHAATVGVLKAALDHDADEAFFIDDLAQIAGQGLTTFVRSDPSGARVLLHAMDGHFGRADWYRRSFDYYNVPLRWIHRVAEAAADAMDLDLVEDACECLFRHEVRLDRWKQKQQTQRWLASISGSVAKRVAGVLRENAEAAKYHSPLPTAIDPSIRAVLRTRE